MQWPNPMVPTWRPMRCMTQSAKVVSGFLSNFGLIEPAIFCSKLSYATRFNGEISVERWGYSPDVFLRASAATGISFLMEAKLSDQVWINQTQRGAVSARARTIVPLMRRGMIGRERGGKEAQLRGTHHHRRTWLHGRTIGEHRKNPFSAA